MIRSRWDDGPGDSRGSSTFFLQGHVEKRDAASLERFGLLVEDIGDSLHYNLASGSWVGGALENDKMPQSYPANAPASRIGDKSQVRITRR